MVVGAAVDYARLEQFKTQLQATVELGGALGRRRLRQRRLEFKRANGRQQLSDVQRERCCLRISAASRPRVGVAGHDRLEPGLYRDGQGDRDDRHDLHAAGVVEPRGVGKRHGGQPAVTITLTANNFKSSAADGNTLWYWLMTSGSARARFRTPTTLHRARSSPATSPATAQMRPLPITASSTQEIGLALQNVTGELSDYGCNQYQTAPVSYQWEEVSNGRFGYSMQYVAVTGSCQGTDAVVLLK